MALSEIELAVLEQSEACPKCGGQGVELSVGSKAEWTLGYDYEGHEIEVLVEVPDVRQVSCSASGCWQGRVHPLGWNAAIEAEVSRLEAQ